jgi:hypothetical protein
MVSGRREVKEKYITIDEYGMRKERRGTLIECDCGGLFYLLADYNKATGHWSVPRYMPVGTENGAILLQIADYRTKKHIDDPVKG